MKIIKTPTYWNPEKCLGTSGKISQIIKDWIIKNVNKIVLTLHEIFLLIKNINESQTKGDHFVMQKNINSFKFPRYPISPFAELTKGSKSPLYPKKEESNGPTGEPLLIHV